MAWPGLVLVRPAAVVGAVLYSEHLALVPVSWLRRITQISRTGLHWRRHGASDEGVSSLHLADGSTVDGVQGRVGPAYGRVHGRVVQANKAGAEAQKQKAEGCQAL